MDWDQRNNEQDEIMSTPLNSTEERQMATKFFRVKRTGEGWYEAEMCDRPKFVRIDSPVSTGSGETEYAAKISAFVRWSRCA